MIIERKYEWFGYLYENDEHSRKIIDDCFGIYGISDNNRKEMLQRLYQEISAFFNLGCGIPGDCYKEIMKQFDILDKTNPYDNRLTFKDVSHIEYETSRKGTAIQMRFINASAFTPYRIIGFASIENTDSGFEIGKGWKMAAPFVGG